MTRYPYIGDAVEIRFAELTEDGSITVWHPGTCVVANDGSGVIGVAYANGLHEMIAAGRWRAVEMLTKDTGA